MQNKRVSPLHVALLFLSVAATIMLNTKAVNIGNLVWWVRYLIPALLFAGVIGIIFGLRLTSYLGSTGIVLFLIAGIISSFPTEDDVLGWTNGVLRVPPKEISEGFIYGRVLVVIAISVAWWSCFRRLRIATAR